ncbi:Endonuclease/Exonuclease/phosphatase family protein [Roseivivax halotolerans]|uniref:Endonuclease/Exonuclease/phosphatase family protein n=1 Tax=Roseivivax halotolerans TaxID=93684 RepID=A0A1I5V508_9RHOB|nr:Endonuclease/Exonuclease/phosphatase family protein [Roseivivax halotolerans]
MRDLVAGEGEDLEAIIAGIDTLDADILLLTDIDHDHELAALGALNDALRTPYPHLFALRPNTGMRTDLDLDGNGRTGEPRDAQGFGWFAGEGGMALLSRHEIGDVTDLSALLWRDVPGSLIAQDDPGFEVQRLSSSGHWIVPIKVSGSTLSLLAYHATPPVFDGPEDRNGRRNHDETMLWAHVLQGALHVPAPAASVMLVGNANIDPVRGEGRREALSALMDGSRLQDRGPFGATALWQAGPGPMRISYILPEATLSVLESGLGPHLPAAGPHRAVWMLIDPAGIAPPDS